MYVFIERKGDDDNGDDCDNDYDNDYDNDNDNDKFFSWTVLSPHSGHVKSRKRDKQ